MKHTAWVLMVHLLWYFARIFQAELVRREGDDKGCSRAFCLSWELYSHGRVDSNFPPQYLWSTSARARVSVLLATGLSLWHTALKMVAGKAACGGEKGQQRFKWACLASSWASRRSLGRSKAHFRLDRVSPHDTRRPFCSLLFFQYIKRTPGTRMTPKFILLPKFCLRRAQPAITQEGDLLCLFAFDGK